MGPGHSSMKYAARGNLSDELGLTPPLPAFTPGKRIYDNSFSDVLSRIHLSTVSSRWIAIGIDRFGFWYVSPAFGFTGGWSVRTCWLGSSRILIISVLFRGPVVYQAGWTSEWTSEWTSAWASAWTSEWTSRWASEWKSRWTSGWASGCTSGWASGWISDWTSGWTPEWTSGWTSGQTSGWTSEWTSGSSYLYLVLYRVYMKWRASYLVLYWV